MCSRDKRLRNWEEAKFNNLCSHSRTPSFTDIFIVFVVLVIALMKLLLVSKCLLTMWTGYTKEISSSGQELQVLRQEVTALWLWGLAGEVGVTCTLLYWWIPPYPQSCWFIFRTFAHDLTSVKVNQEPSEGRGGDKILDLVYYWQNSSKNLRCVTTSQRLPYLSLIPPLLR